MAIETAVRPHRSPDSSLTSSRNAPNEVERLTISSCQPAGPTTNGHVAWVDGAPLQALLAAVDDQRLKLVNVLGIVHSMSTFFTDTAEDSAPEISAAFNLLEREIRRVVAGLKKASLHDPR
jgi:hypothetical protein